jgi:tRNA A37 methylthiotransferase MiaB
MLNFKEEKSSVEMGKNVFIYSIACERRDIDAQKIYSYLSKNNYNIISDPKEADYTILMTCGFVKSQSDASLELIKKFKQYDSELIVAGCLPDIIETEFERIFDGKIIPTKDMDKIDEIFNCDTIKLGDLDDEHSMWQNLNKRTYSGIVQEIFLKFNIVLRIGTYFVENIFKKIFGKNFSKTFPFNRLIPDYDTYCILISRGCVHNCTYCAIRKAVGPLKSKSQNQCVKEFKAGLKKGYKNFVLDADDVGPYGVDIKSSLPKLLDKITNIDGNYSIEIKNTHPIWIIKYASELEEILKRKKIKSMLLSIQSGNNRILKLMGRFYSKEKLIDTILQFKKVDPDLEVGVQLMVGFPTEKIEEFQETLELFEKVTFDFGSIFPFSCQKETKASEMEPKIQNREIRRRTKDALKFLRTKDYFAWYWRRDGGVSFYKR